jgi:Flp pilus assembly protein CpaB
VPFRRKLPRSAFVLLSASLACALAAALVMRAYARRLDVLRPDGGPPVAVVAAARDIGRGEVLDAADLEVVTVPARFAPPGAIRDDVERATGRVAIAAVADGEIVTARRLVGAGAGPTASLVPPGMRAIQVPVAATVGVRPGDLVDVIATFGGGGAHTEVAGEGLEVLAIVRGGGGGSFGAAATPTTAQGLVVLVTPTDAERLAFAATFATLSIAVRAPGDVVPGESFAVPANLDG